MPHRNNYCVKEVSNLPLALCGKTQYYGDKYDVGQCVYKKCDSECKPGKFTFIWDGKQYTRNRYCCNNNNMCNGNILLYDFYFFDFNHSSIYFSCFLVFSACPNNHDYFSCRIVHRFCIILLVIHVFIMKFLFLR
jgi:hypothetical protein